ncbi:MAG: vWA domain-containing protein [Phycisphaerae bacterium]
MVNHLKILQQSVSDAVTHWCLAIDASLSMGFTDYPPTRLYAAQEAALAFLDLRARCAPNDLVGLVAFAQQASICFGLAPPATVKSALQQIEVAPWTNLTAGLDAAQSILLLPVPALPSKGLRGRIGQFFKGMRNDSHCAPHVQPRCRILLLSDGVDNVSPPGACVAVGQRIKNLGVEIDIVGIGGSRSQVNEAELMEIASRDDQGRPRYQFIGDKVNLIEAFKSKAIEVIDPPRRTA